MSEDEEYEMTRELSTLAAAYALDAVSEDERLFVEAGLGSYPEIAREVEELRTAAGLLAEPLTEQPPAWLRSSVLSRIAEVRQLPPQIQDDADPAGRIAEEPTVDQRPAAVTTSLPAGVADLDARRERRARRAAHVAPRAGWRQSLASAAVAAAVAVAVVLGVQHQLRTSVPSPQASMSQILAQPDVQVTQTAVAGTTARATIAWTDTGRRAVVYLSSLADPPSSHTYQLWLIAASGVATSKGTFTPVGGSVQLTADGLTPGQSVGVTVEPAGGSPKPTTRPIFAVQLA